MMTTNSETIALRQWIKDSLRSVGQNNNGTPAVASSAYMAASLKIAAALAVQISRAEKLADLGVYRELEVLPISSVGDWAKFVWVRLNTRESYNSLHKRPVENDNEWLDQPLPHETCPIGSIGALRWEDQNEQTIDEHLDIFLESLDADECEPADAAAQTRHDALAPLPETSAVSKGSKFCQTTSSQAENLNYLHVDSACIRHPESEPSDFFNSHANTSKNNLRRIFLLGLVFYELFSGGEVPPRGLLALMSSERAFLSLPTLTLTDKEKDDGALKCDFKRHQGPSKSANGIGLCQLSYEYLKFMGLPGPLCSLIFNMLDSVYGDFSGNDCYAKMTDVTSDLQLMIDKPEKFLRDLDMEKLSLSGLELNETAFLREDELTSIQSCYHRSVTESCELAIITGESGTGKSWLAQHVGRFILTQGGLFLTGKFDQMKQVAPFSALASAFDQFCDVLILEKRSEWVKQIVSKLNAVLGQDAYHLIKVIPKFHQILTCNTAFADSSSSENCVNAVQRLHYLLCQFVDVISTFSSVSVTLFLDDLQWADSASISVLSQLLLKRYKRFFVLGCCRSSEMEDNHPFWDMVENVRAFDVKTTLVELGCMDKDTLNLMVSDLLCLTPRVVRSLSDIIYTKTKGNPLFFSQLMLSLNKDGLLRLSFSGQRWVWDEEEIQSMKLPDDVALCFATGISKLPLEVQSALRTLSLFGASAKCEYIKALESHLNVHLIEPLNIAITEGLVQKVRASFHFCHDRIQEVSYSMIEEQDRSRDHLVIGLCLVKLSLDTGDHEMMFMAVNQINFCGPSAIVDAQESANMAKYNLMAGKKAMEMSDFLSSFSYFSFGIDFLPHGHWRDHYDLSLELFDLASNSALATGNIGSLHILANEVFYNAKSFEDKLNIYFNVISSLAYASKVSESMEQGCKILSHLGEDIPKHPSIEALDQHIKHTQSLIRGVSENDILNHKLMTDEKKLLAMKFLAQLESITLMVKPSLHPFVTLKMVQLTMSNGLSPVSPVGFVYFGSLLAKRGNIQLGYRFTLLAKALLENLEAREFAGEVICVATEVLCYVQPVQTASKLLIIQGEPAAMRGGDIRSACFIRLSYCAIMFWTCPNLSLVNKAFSEACRFMREHQHRSSLFLMLPIQKTILTLMGSEAEAITDNQLTSCIQENKNPRHLMILSFYDLYRSFLLNDDGAEEECGEKFYDLKKTSWFLYFGDSAQALIVGLVAFQLYRKTQDSLWLERGRKCKADMKLWEEQGSFWNFQHKQLMLEAEEHYCIGNLDHAQSFYENAIASARSHKFINDEALACELAAKFYYDTGNLTSSLEYYRLAHEKYHEWGALSKADRLFASVNKMFSNILGNNSLFFSRTVSEVDPVYLEGSAELDPRKRRVV